MAKPNFKANSKPNGRPTGGKTKFTMRRVGAGTGSTGSRPSSSTGRHNHPPPKADDTDEDDSELSPSSGEESEPDTEDEIRVANAAAGPKSKKTQKRKRRAVDPSAFGEALVGLLGPSAPVPVAPAPEGQDGSDISSGEREGSEEADEVDAAQADEANEDSSDEEAAQEPKKPIKRARVSSELAPNTSAQGPILALAPHIKRADAKASLASKAERQLVTERKRAFEVTHVKDVISSWGPPGQVVTYDGDLVPALGGAPLDDDALAAWDDQGGSGGYEKRLRKVAQRGVVKLFNVIRDSQRKASAPPVEEETSGLVRSVMGKPPLHPGAKKSLASKDSFLDMIKAGGKP